jgi:RHS repeat-associated protein
VGGSGLEYDAAGNLTKDRLGYEYEYDYENRIVKVTKDNNDIAEFAYDALGRRIRKTDCASNTNTLYYYNDNWQVLCEYDGGGSFERLFMYGNYIDEPIMTYSGGIYFYVQDHLYSTAALVDAAGAPQERYEYDAYGQAHILDANFADDADGVSDCGNPYMFTGRRVDFLDGGKLTLQVNRHRYYDYYTGRWLTEDPVRVKRVVGRTLLVQYVDGVNLYEYVQSAPEKILDALGLAGCSAEGEGWFKRAEADAVFAEFWSEHVLHYKWEKPYECTEECHVDSSRERITYSNVEHIPDAVSFPPIVPVGLTIEEKAVILDESHQEASGCGEGKSGSKEKVTVVVGDVVEVSVSFLLTYSWRKTVARHTFEFEIDCCCSKSCGKVNWNYLLDKGPIIVDPPPGGPISIGPAPGAPMIGPALHGGGF